jgi:hypothetical protein
MNLWDTIREALTYAAEDYAERANIEAKHRDEDDEPDEEEAGYREASDRYSAALAMMDEAQRSGYRPLWLNEEVQS